MTTIHGKCEECKKVTDVDERTLVCSSCLDSHREVVEPELMPEPEPAKLEKKPTPPAESKKLSALDVVDEKDWNSSNKLLNAYLTLGAIGDFSKIPTNTKLTVLQKTPKSYIKTRKVANAMVPYVEHDYVERALNFVFNFNVSAEIQHHEFLTYRETVTDWSEKDEQGQGIPRKVEKEAIEARVLMRFTFRPVDGDPIVRDVYSSHKGFANPATTRGDIMTSAISKGWTKVGRTFGIGADIKKREESAFNRASKNSTYSAPAKKSFGGPQY